MIIIALIGKNKIKFTASKSMTKFSVTFLYTSVEMRTTAL